jgi:hypothetical protein
MMKFASAGLPPFSHRCHGPRAGVRLMHECLGTGWCAILVGPPRWADATTLAPPFRCIAYRIRGGLSQGSCACHADD